MIAADELPMYYTVSTGNPIGNENTTYCRVSNSDHRFVIVCDGKQITVTFRDLFRLLKWAYEQWGGDAE